MNLHVDPTLLGSKIYNTKTRALRKIIAAWMEEAEKKAYRPSFVVLTVSVDTNASHHDLRKITLPDVEGEWELLT